MTEMSYAEQLVADKNRLQKAHDNLSGFYSNAKDGYSARVGFKLHTTEKVFGMKTRYSKKEFIEVPAEVQAAFVAFLRAKVSVVRKELDEVESKLAKLGANDD